MTDFRVLVQLIIRRLGKFKGHPPRTAVNQLPCTKHFTEGRNVATH